MIVLVVCCVMLLWLGRDDIGVFWSIGIAAAVVVGGLMALFLNLSPLIPFLGLVALDVCLLLRMFGSDIVLR
jgi:hypothetical protein